jgi:glutamyl-tRNA synthetase
MSTVITRFAPSPTGLLHCGNYRTAVFAYLFAKHTGGTFVVRIEDTDRARSKKEYEDNIFEALEWLQLPADATYRQSDHRARHRALLEQLVDEGVAYVSKEIPEAPGDREEVIRFRNPGGALTFTDLIRGDITTDVSDLGDFIIARSFDEPVFHFAVVVDDADEGVTHVIRGGDHISNTARQLLIQNALGFNTPMYAHLPLIVDSAHKKLSKRAGAKAVTQYRDMGILPEALLNYLAFIGWNPGDEREFMTKSELIEAFDLSRVQKGSAVFDEVKLLSINQHWMRELSVEDFIERGKLHGSDASMVTKLVPQLKERAQTFIEAQAMLDDDLSFFFAAPQIDAEGLSKKEPADRAGLTKDALLTVQKVLIDMPKDLAADAVKALLMPLADALEAGGKGGRGAMLWPLRYALSGKERSPDPFTIIALLGKDASIARVNTALGLL